MTERPRVLVLTPSSGEREYDACCRAVREQRGVAATHEVIANKPKAEAHRLLYARIMAARAVFTYFVKLDADMVLNGPDTLRACIDRMAAHRPAADHMKFTVRDWITQRDIWGMHLYANTVSWPSVEADPGFDRPDPARAHGKDPDPVRHHGKVKVRDAPAPVAMHAPDPGIDQAVYYGLDHTAKAVHIGRRTPKQVRHAWRKWRDLVAVRDHYRRNPDRRLALILAVAKDATQLSAPVSSKHSADFAALRDRHAERGLDELHAEIAPFWLRPGVAWRTWARRVAAIAPARDEG